MVRIIINEKVPSVNHLYYHKPPFGVKVLSVKARPLRERIIKETIKQLKAQGYYQPKWNKRLLKVKVEIYENWFTKKHTVFKKDIANKEKFLIDSIFKGLDLDDSYVWRHELSKVDSQEFKVIVTIERWTPEPSAA